MFTGIIEQIGKVKSIETDQGNFNFEIEAAMTPELKVDQSVAHDGVCLTVTAIEGGVFQVTAIQETLNKTNLKYWRPGTSINLERCMPANGRFDGHIVQGHVDQVGEVLSIAETDGSWLITIGYDASLGNVTVEKGSITLNGISLTCFDSTENTFSVAIIPYTYTHTAIHSWKKGDWINLEFDIVGKYVKKLLNV